MIEKVKPYIIDLYNDLNKVVVSKSTVESLLTIVKMTYESRAMDSTT